MLPYEAPRHTFLPVFFRPKTLKLFISRVFTKLNLTNIILSFSNLKCLKHLGKREFTGRQHIAYILNTKVGGKNKTSFVGFKIKAENI